MKCGFEFRHGESNVAGEVNNSGDLDRPEPEAVTSEVVDDSSRPVVALGTVQGLVQKLHDPPVAAFMAANAGRSLGRHGPAEVKAVVLIVGTEVIINSNGKGLGLNAI